MRVVLDGCTDIETARTYHEVCEHFLCSGHPRERKGRQEQRLENHDKSGGGGWAEISGWLCAVDLRFALLYDAKRAARAPLVIPNGGEAVFYWVVTMAEHGHATMRSSAEAVSTC